MITDQMLAQATLEYDQAMLDSLPPAPHHEFPPDFETKFKTLSRKAKYLAARKLLTAVAILTIVFVCVASLSVGITYAAKNLTEYQQLGAYYAEVHDKMDSGNGGKVLAKYEDLEITEAIVDYQHKVSAMLYEPIYETDFQTVNRVIRGRMILDEAKRLGLSATQAEIDASMEASRSVMDLPGGKQLLEEYCEGAGMTIEEYFETLEKQFPEMIAKNKLKNKYAREYCEKNGLEYQQGVYNAEVDAAVEEKLNELFEKNKHKIRYYMNAEGGNIMNGQRIVTGIAILLSCLTFILLFAAVAIDKLVYKYGKTKTVQAEVVSTYRIERNSYKGGGTKVECGVVFKTETGKKLSFHISELSYPHYRKGETGILKYKAHRLIDFS